MRTLCLTRLTLAAALLAAPALALAQPAMDGAWHHHGGEGMELLRGLALTSTQQDQVKSILQAAHQSGRTMGTQMRATHEQLAAALLSGATMDQLQPIVAREEAMRNEADLERLKVAVQIRGVLTAAQLSQAADEHAKLVSLHEQEHAVTGDH